MLKDKLSRVFSNKVFYIVFSIFASVALWMYVEFTQNPMEKIVVENVPVVLLNRDTLRDKNLVITSSVPETVTLTYEGKRGILPKLTNSVLSVTVDLANITSTGPTSLTYSRPVLPPDVNDKDVSLLSRSVERITLTVDKLSERTVPVKGKYDGGTISEEYIADTPEFNPTSLTVYGPDSIVAKVDSALVKIAVEELSSTYTDDLPFVLLDADGGELSQEVYEALDFSVENIRTVVPVKMVKEVTLSVELLAGAGATSQNTRVSITPSKITLSGEPDAIKDFNTITLSTVDLTKMDLTTSLMLPIVVPNNYINLSGETEAFVTVDVLGLDIRHVQTTNLIIVNEPKGYTSNIITRSLDVKIRGTEAALIDLAETSVRVVADLTNYSPGVAHVPAKVYIDGVDGDMGAVGEYRLTVSIFKE